MKRKTPFLLAAHVSMLCLCAISQSIPAQKVMPVPAIDVEFLKPEFGSPASAMGDAQTAVPNGVLSAYWNPAGLGLMKGTEAAAGYTILSGNAGYRFVFAGTGLGKIGTVAAGLLYHGVGSETGRAYRYDWSKRIDNLALSFSWAGNLNGWLAIGATYKSVSYYILSEKHRTSVLDAGVLICLTAGSRTGKREDGIKFGLSLGNCGLGHDDEYWVPRDQPLGPGEYGDPMGEYATMVAPPAVFRLGFSFVPVSNETNRMTLAIDAVHSSHYSEYLCLGTEDRITLSRIGSWIVRAGYRDIFTKDGEYRFTAGTALEWRFRPSLRIEAGYSWVENIHARDWNGFYLSLKF
jgi:hypothetical protein